MPSLSQCVRAWLAFTTLQDIGAIWMCYAGHTLGLLVGATASNLRQHALNIMLLVVTRVFLLVYFDSTPLHLCNITITSLFTLHIVAEMFYYQDTSSVLANSVRVIVHVLSIAVLSVYYSRVIAAYPPSSQRKKGHLSASHYLESDFLDPLDSKKFQQLRKKQ